MYDVSKLLITSMIAVSLAKCVCGSDRNAQATEGTRERGYQGGNDGHHDAHDNDTGDGHDSGDEHGWSASSNSALTESSPEPTEFLVASLNSPHTESSLLMSATSSALDSLAGPGLFASSTTSIDVPSIAGASTTLSSVVGPAPTRTDLFTQLPDISSSTSFKRFQRSSSLWSQSEVTSSMSVGVSASQAGLPTISTMSVFTPPLSSLSESSAPLSQSASISTLVTRTPSLASSSAFGETTQLTQNTQSTTSSSTQMTTSIVVVAMTSTSGSTRVSQIPAPITTVLSSSTSVAAIVLSTLSHTSQSTISSVPDLTETTASPARTPTPSKSWPSELTLITSGTPTSTGGSIATGQETGSGADDNKPRIAAAVTVGTFIAIALLIIGFIYLRRRRLAKRYLNSLNSLHSLHDPSPTLPDIPLAERNASVEKARPLLPGERMPSQEGMKAWGVTEGYTDPWDTRYYRRQPSTMPPGTAM